MVMVRGIGSVIMVLWGIGGIEVAVGVFGVLWGCKKNRENMEKNDNA